MGSSEAMEDDQDQIISKIGKFGKWQLKYFILLCFVTLPTAWPSLSITFLNANTDFWCARPDGEIDKYENVTQWRELSSPLIVKADEKVRDQCHVYKSFANEDQIDQVWIQL